MLRKDLILALRRAQKSVALHQPCHFHRGSISSMVGRHANPLRFKQICCSIGGGAGGCWRGRGVLAGVGAAGKHSATHGASETRHWKFLKGRKQVKSHLERQTRGGLNPSTWGGGAAAVTTRHQNLRLFCQEPASLGQAAPFDIKYSRSCARAAAFSGSPPPTPHGDTYIAENIHET